MSNMTAKATTGVVAVVRPGSTGLEADFPRTQAPFFLLEGTGLPFSAQAAINPTARKAVITQDPYDRVSGKQLWSHPPV